MKNKLIIILFFICSICAHPLHAEESPTIEFDKDVLYDVYCQAGDENLLKIEQVHIKNIKQMDNLKFLVVQPESKRIIAKNDEAFINLSCIKSILPSYFSVNVIQSSGQANK